MTPCVLGGRQDTGVPGVDWVGLAAQPVPYDYGGNVVVQSAAVYINGEGAGTPQEYAAQASQLAGTGLTAQPAEDTTWLPLGVFAVVEGDQTSSDDVFQLAVDRQGVIRGRIHRHGAGWGPGRCAFYKWRVEE